MSGCVIFAAASVFSPKQLPNLSLWLDADDASTLTLVSSKVSQWNDKSTFGTNVSQSTSGNRPASGTNTLNGRNVITFTGSNSNYLISANGQNQCRACPGYTVFAVGRHTDSANSGRFVAMLPTTGSAFSGKLNTGIQASTQKAFFGARRVDTDASSNLLSASAWGTGYGVFCGIGTFSTTTGFLYERTTQLATSTSWCTTGPNSDAQQGYVFIGCDPGAPTPPVTAFLTGDIAEIILCNGELSSTDRLQTTGYLQGKWGL